MGYDRRGSRLRLLPLVIPIGGLFAAGAVVTAVQSFGFLNPFAKTGAGTDAWMYLFSDPWLLRSLTHSLTVAVVSAGLSVILGTLLAWGIHNLPAGLRGAATVYKIPLILPHITVAYLAILMFGQSGILSSLAARLGLIGKPGDFPNVLYGGRGTGIILAYLMKETSFVILMVTGMLRKLDPHLVRTARMLGASRFRTFRTVVIPHVRPALVSSFLILSLYALGAFEIPWLIGESRPEMISVTAFNLYFHRDLAYRPQAAAMLTLLMILSLALLWPWLAVVGKRRDRA